MSIVTVPETTLPRISGGILLLVAAIAACFCTPQAFGQTNSAWNGGIGNWSNATDWNPNQVPNNGGGNAYNVTIDTGGDDVVTLDQNATISSLTLGGLSGSSDSNLEEAYEKPENLTVTGSVTVNQTGQLFVGYGSAFSVEGNLTNSGLAGTDYELVDSTPSSLTVTGTFTNNAGASLYIGGVGTTGGVDSVGTLVNNGFLQIGFENTGSTLDLTNQPNGITDVVKGSTIELSGTIKAGANNGLANLASIEGTLDLTNQQSLTLTPSVLTVSNTGNLYLAGTLTSMTVANLTNSGIVGLDSQATLTVTGTFTNQAGATLNLGTPMGSELGTLNASSLSNNGTVNIKRNTTLVITGGVVTNTGTINLSEGTLEIDSNTSLSGKGGKIILSNLSSNVIEGAAGTDILTNVNNTITGSGNIGNGKMGLVNSGVIVASHSVPLTIDVSSSGFDNTGTIQANASDTLIITGAANSFLNFNSTTDTLTGGTYIVVGTLKFDDADIVTNAGNITLSGKSSQILNNVNNDNALANFATNAKGGSFTLVGNQNFTTSGAFSNAGIINVSKGSTFTVGGSSSYTQSAGTTTVSGILAASGGVNVSGGSVFGIGTVTANIDVTGGLLSPGAGSKKAGELGVSGNYAQSGAGAFDVDLGGVTAGTQYDVLNITSTASLGGTLDVDLISGFKPAVGETFDIMDYTSETGTFATLNLPKLTGGDTWSISYNATGVVLTVDGPTAADETASGASAKRVSRAFTGSSPPSAQKPVSMLARATCFAERLIGAASCDTASVTIRSDGPEERAGASMGAGKVHNNIMIATRSISGARGGASQETSASASAMARLYVCAYLPSSVGHAGGCN